MKNRSNKRKNWADELPDDVRERMLQAVADIERDMGEIDSLILYPDERAEMEAGLKELRQSLIGAGSESLPAKHRMH